MAIVHPRLPLAVQHTRITADDLVHVLGYASVNRLSPEAACKELEAAPSANRFREVLAAALPKRPALQRALNTLLRQPLPRSLRQGKRSYALALDVTLIPYHGQPHQAANEIVRGEPKSGTTHFHGYATVSIVHSQRRYVLAVRFIEAKETMATVVWWLLDRVKALKIWVRRVYLDKGFCAIEVFRALDRRKLSYVVPIPGRGKSGGIRRIFQGAASFIGRLTHSRVLSMARTRSGPPVCAGIAMDAMAGTGSNGSPMPSLACHPV